MSKERAQAARRVSDAKDRMDEAQRILERAEVEWHQACRDLDRIDGSGDYQAMVDAVNHMTDDGKFRRTNEDPST